MSALVVVVGRSGDVRFVHDDALIGTARSIGAVSIRRASNVEPDERGEWVADLAPVGGPKLAPTATRAAALAAEHEWLVANGIPEPRS